MIAEPIKRPVLRYHGGKFKLAKWIISHFPEHRVYCEPFAGAASVLLQKPRTYSEVINDMDGEVCNVFRVLRDPTQARELERLLRLTPFARIEFDAAYLAAADPIEQARRSIVRSFMGFGSAAHNSDHKTGFRANSNRSGTTPAHDWCNYPNVLTEFTARLMGVVIENRAAAEIIQQHDSFETLHYVDPPYPLSTRNSLRKNGCYRFEMTDDDHRALASVLYEVFGMVVLSGYPCELYDRELFPDWQRIERPSFADGAEPRTEVLWLNAAASQRLAKEQQQLSLVDAPCL